MNVWTVPGGTAAMQTTGTIPERIHTTTKTIHIDVTAKTTAYAVPQKMWTRAAGAHTPLHVGLCSACSALLAQTSSTDQNGWSIYTPCTVGARGIGMLGCH